jgi:hypothetical protein
LKRKILVFAAAIGPALTFASFLGGLQACSSSSDNSGASTPDGSTDGTTPGDEESPDTWSGNSDSAPDTMTSSDAGDESTNSDASDASDAGASDGGDAAQDAVGDAATDAATTPSSVLGQNLALWLEADKGVTTDPSSSAVTGWQDQSGNGNNATTMGITDGGMPMSVNPTAINNRPAIHFPGSTTYLSIPDAASLHFGSNNVFTWVIATGHSPQAAYSRMVWTKQNVNGPYIGFGLFMNLNNGYSIASILAGAGPYAVCDQDAGSMAYNNGQPLFIEATRTQSALTINAWAGGDAGASCGASVPPVISDAGVDLTNISPLRIGGQGGSAQALTGDIAAIIIAMGSVTDAQRRAVSDYLSRKYVP